MRSQGAAFYAVMGEATGWLQANQVALVDAKRRPKARKCIKYDYDGDDV